MTTVATINVMAQLQDNVSAKLTGMSDRIRFAGMRLRNAGIGLTIATAPLAMIFGKMAKDAMEYEQITVGIQKVSQSTGRDIAEVMQIINQHSGEMASKLEITRGALKLMSTELTTPQIGEFIQLVKDGAAAMGEDFGTQLVLVTRGFKQLNPNVIDNIGINIRMREIYRKADQQMTETGNTLANMIDSNDELSEAQKDVMITQILFTEMQRKGGVYTGVYSEYMNSTAGRVAKLNTALKDLSVSFGTYLMPEIDKLVVNLTNFMNRVNSLNDDIKRTTITSLGWGVMLAFVGGTITMIGGNFLWAAGQLAMFVTGAKGLTIATLPALIAKFAALAATIIACGFIASMVAGIIVKGFDILRDVIIDTTTFISTYITTISLRIAEIAKLWAEIGKDDTGVKKWGKQVRELRGKLQELEFSAKKAKESTKEIVGITTYPLMTLGEKGRWGKDINKWIEENIFGELVTTTPSPTTPSEDPSFQPPMSGMPTGNLVINIYSPDGQYGSQINLGSLTSLMETVGQDTVINAGVSNRYEP